MLLISIFAVLLHYEMLHTIFIKCKVDVMYFIFIFISSSVPRFSVKKSVNQLIKNKRPNERRKLFFKDVSSFSDVVTCLTKYPKNK